MSGKLTCMMCWKAQNDMNNIFWKLMSHQIKCLDSTAWFCKVKWDGLNSVSVYKYKKRIVMCTLHCKTFCANDRLLTAQFFTPSHQFLLITVWNIEIFSSSLIIIITIDIARRNSSTKCRDLSVKSVNLNCKCACNLSQHHWSQVNKQQHLLESIKTLKPIQKRLHIQERLTDLSVEHTDSITGSS